MDWGCYFSCKTPWKKLDTQCSQHDLHNETKYQNSILPCSLKARELENVNKMPAPEKINLINQFDLLTCFHCRFKVKQF